MSDTLPGMAKSGLLGVGLTVVALGMASCGGDDDTSQGAGGGTGGDGASGGDGAGGPAAGRDSVAGASTTSGTSSGGGSDAAGMTNAGGVSASGAGGAPDSAGCMLVPGWEVVDDYAYTEGVQSNVASIAADKDGNVYAVGLGRAGQNQLVGVVRRSLNAGVNWTNGDWDTARPSVLPNDAAVDDDGNVFVTAGTSTGSVFKSVNHGMSFEKVFDIPTTPAAAPCSTGFVATGPSGVVVAGGSCDDDGWTVHKSVNGGETWAPAFTFLLAPGKSARLHDVGVGPDGTAYASGYGVDASDKIHWLVVREGAGTGVISDQFQLEAGQPARAFGFATRGAPTVTGSAADADGTHGVVRHMTAPDTWKTLDVFATRGADVEAVGPHLVVTGQLEDPTVHAMTRQSDDGGTVWADSVQYEYAAAQPAFVGALTVDGTGAFYSVISARDQDAIPHWIVRKLACE